MYRLPLLLLLFSLQTAAAQTEPAPQQDPAALKLLMSAAAASTVPDAATPSFSLTATVHTFDRAGKPTGDGSITEQAVRGGTWKRTETFGGQTSSTYFNGNQTLHAGSYMSSFWMNQMTSVLFSPLPLKDAIASLNLQMKPLKGNGIELDCVNFSPAGPKYDSPNGYCFSGQPPQLRTINPSTNVQIILSKLLNVGRSVLPQQIEIYSDGNLRASLHLDKIVLAPTLTAADLAPPADATVLTRYFLLGAVGATKKLSGDLPLYPSYAKTAHVQGTVYLQAVIGTDGKVQSLDAVDSPATVLTDAAMDAVRTWRYKPYVKDGQAVEFIVPIVVMFSFAR